MTKRTKILVAVGILLGLPLIALVVVPLAFRDRIMARVKAEANQAVNARVDWRNVGLSLFRDFPNVTLSLDGFSVAGTGPFDGDTLTTVRRLHAVLDLASVVRSARRGAPIIVRSVELDHPRVALRVTEDGRANWDIVKETPADSVAPSRPLTVSLKRLDVRDATLSMDNRQSRLVASITGYRQALSGDFSKDVFTLTTQAHADTVSLAFAGISYLNDVALDVSADIGADMRTKKFTFGKNEVRLNTLALAFSGSATAGDTNVALDVAFNAPRTDFKDILSLVPAVYTKDFQTLRTSGAVAVSGRVTGAYGDHAFPAFSVNAKVTNGAFQYPDLPLPARDIGIDLALRNPGGNVDSTVVQLDRFHATIGGEPLDGTLVLRTPVSDPDVDLRLTGQLDLAALRKTVKMPDVNELSGRVAADVAVRTRMSYVDEKRYDRVMARGTLTVRDLALRTTDLPHPLAIQEASLQLSPQRADLRSLTGRIGSSDLRLSGYLENLLPFALRGDPLRGRATLASQHVTLDEWQSGDDSLEVIPVPANIDFDFQATVAELVYGKLTATNARGGLRVRDERATLESFTMNAVGGQLGVTGYYETTDITRPAFDVDFRLTNVDIPSAAEAFATVRALAPVARYARGNVSTDLHLAGPLGKDMLPQFTMLSGRGTLRTSQLAVEGLPILLKVADALKLEQLRSPTLDSVRASIQISDGRVHVTPFNVRVGRSLMRVSGSHGVDQSLDYTLRLAVPRAELGADANRAIAGVISRAGRTGIDLQTADTVAFDIKVGGTLTSPNVQVNLGDVIASAGQAVKQAVQQEAAERVDSLEARADSAAGEARRRAQAEGERLVREAEERAAAIREEAQRLAEDVRREGNARADSLVARTTNPLARAAAKAAADRLRKEANDKADAIVREADRRATDLVAEARKKAGGGG